MSLYNHFDENQQEILRERARRVATAAQEDNSIATREVLLARVQNERYMLPVELVLAVYEGIGCDGHPVRTVICGRTSQPARTSGASSGSCQSAECHTVTGSGRQYDRRRCWW